MHSLLPNVPLVKLKSVSVPDPTRNPMVVSSSSISSLKSSVTVMVSADFAQPLAALSELNVGAPTVGATPSTLCPLCAGSAV